MKPLGIIVLAYIAGLFIFFARDYFIKKDEQDRQENNNKDKTEG